MAGGIDDGARTTSAAMLRPAASATPAPPEVSTGRLPVTSPDLFGRDDELAWLDTCWAQGVHVATLVAWGGVGKSALVNKWLATLRDDGWRGADKVFGWSFYSQGTDRLSSSDDFIDAALRWFGDADPKVGSPWDKGERLTSLVRKQRSILVLDGVEPLQWGPGVQHGKLKDPALQALLKGLGAQNNGLCVVTSRIHMTDLEALAGDKVQEHGLDQLSDEAGARLLNARGAKGSEQELRGAAREYKGHALALTLLGSYLADVADGDIRQRNEIGPLEEDERQGEHARRVMAAYEKWLGKPERSILHMIGLFDRPAGEDEIAALRAAPAVPGLTDAVAGLGTKEWNKALANLRRVGLVARAENDKDRRLDAHPLVREHFGEQVRRETEDAWREGHRRLYEHLRAKAKELPDSVEEMAPLYAAVGHGCRAGKNQEALHEVWLKRIRRGGEHFSTKKLGAFGSEVAVLSAFFDPPWARLAPGLTDAAGPFVLNSAGFALRALGRLPEAAELMRMAADRVVAQEDWEHAAIGASNLGELLQAKGELREALEQARKSVDLADKSGDAQSRIVNRTTLAAALHARGRREEATAVFEEAERMQKERQTTYPLLYSIQGSRYCDILLDQGRDAEVRERAAQTLAWAEAHGGLLSIALDHLSLGLGHLLGAQRGAGGDLAQAAYHLAASVDGLRRAGTQHNLPLGLLGRAALHNHTGAFALARGNLDEALSLATRCGLRLHEADAHLGHARLCLAERDPVAAAGHLATARAIVEETGYHRRDEALAGLEAEARAMPPPPPPQAPLPSATPSPAPVAHVPRGSAPMTTPTTTQAVDIGIVVALLEELRELLALAEGHAPHPDADLDSFLFTRGSYRCAVTLVGEMGGTHAGLFTDRLIARFDPGVILSIGIAGGVNDLLAGDVHVPPQAVEYIQDAKAGPAGADGFAIVPGAPAYRADFALLRAVRSFELRHPAEHKKWVAACAADLVTLLSDATKRSALIDGGEVRGDVRLLADGHVATGPIVGAAKAFSDWIRSHDRQVKSIEMESAAVLLAAQTRAEPKRALAIRGISDFGDEHKKELDKKGDGVLRKYAMRNAVRLLWALLDAEALPRNPS